MRSSWRLLIHVLVLSALVVLAACGATPARSQQSRSSDPRHDTRPTPIVVQTVTPGVIVAAHTVDAVVEGRVAQGGFRSGAPPRARMPSSHSS